MLAVPCGLPSYVGAWPPVVLGASMIQPLADLAGSTPHAASACAGVTRVGARKQVAAGEPPVGEDP